MQLSWTCVSINSFTSKKSNGTILHCDTEKCCDEAVNTFGFFSCLIAQRDHRLINYILAWRLCTTDHLVFYQSFNETNLGSATKQEQRNNETGLRCPSLSQQISEFPLRCESSLHACCLELGSYSYLILVSPDLLLRVDWRAVQLSAQLNSCMSSTGAMLNLKAWQSQWTLARQEGKIKQSSQRPFTLNMKKWTFPVRAAVLKQMHQGS